MPDDAKTINMAKLLKTIFYPIERNSLFSSTKFDFMFHV